jgi:F-type H+-transporting ATPase subunit b
MKRLNFMMRLLFLAIAVTMSLHFFRSEALATENTSHWRSIYDLVLMYLNFAIFAFLLVKFGKKPLMNFLRQRKEQIEREVKRVEEERDRANQQVKETLKQIEESKDRFAEIKEKIIKHGEKKKQEIIQDAMQESKILLSEAKRRIDNQILKAKDQFQAELVDAAVATALERLPGEITAKDNQRFLDQYITSTNSG